MVITSAEKNLVIQWAQLQTCFSCAIDGKILLSDEIRAVKVGRDKSSISCTYVYGIHINANAKMFLSPLLGEQLFTLE